MKHIQPYKKFKESLQIDLYFDDIDLMESLSIWHDTLLSTIKAEEVDIFDEFKLPKDEFVENLDIDYLSDNTVFINSLASIALKKSTVQSTDDFESFLNKPCKFMFIYKIEANELENPDYILFQSFSETLKEWEDVKLYKINDDVKKFYDKLTSKVIEISDGEEKYIYSTSNGNEWTLQNNKENETYKKVIRKDDFEKLLSDRKVKINII